MTDFSLGQVSHHMTLVLSAGADFVASLTRNDGEPWPTTAGSGVYLQIGDTTWWATAAGATVSWDVDQTDVDALIATNPTRARLYYVNGETRVLWAAGPVIVK